VIGFHVGIHFGQQGSRGFHVFHFRGMAL
jgi:hypothetical protein